MPVTRRADPLRSAVYNKCVRFGVVVRTTAGTGDSSHVPALQGCVCRPSVGMPRRGGILIPPAFAGCLLHVGRGLRPPPRMANGRGSALANIKRRGQGIHPTSPPYRLTICGGGDPAVAKPLFRTPPTDRRGGISIPPAFVGCLLHVGRTLCGPPCITNVCGSALANIKRRGQGIHPTSPPYRAVYAGPRSACPVGAGF
jgi:hypothetical protein